MERVTAHRRAAIERVMQKIGPQARDRLAAAFDEFATAAGEPLGVDHHLARL